MYVVAVLAGNISLLVAAIEAAGIDLPDSMPDPPYPTSLRTYHSCFNHHGQHLIYLAAIKKDIRILEFLLTMYTTANWEHAVNFFIYF